MSDNQETTTELEPAIEAPQVDQVEEQVDQSADDSIEQTQPESETAAPAGVTIPDFRAGDTLRLGVRIKEGEKVRIQYFEGIVLSRKGMGVNKTFTIRKIGAGGIAVERIFPLYSPSLASYEVRRRGVTRRAKVYFLRDIVGSTANVIKERKVVRDHTATKAAKSAKKAARLAKKTETKPKATAKKSGTRSANRATTKKSAE